MPTTIGIILVGTGVLIIFLLNTHDYSRLCKECNRRNPRWAKYCPRCGIPVEKTEIEKWKRLQDNGFLPKGPLNNLSKQKDYTKADLDFLHKYSKCPDCKIGDFLAGPEAGGSQNFLCSNCKQVICYNVFGATRIQPQEVAIAN